MNKEQDVSNQDKKQLQSDVHRLKVKDKEIILVGTAHISKQSADLVREIIETERPDCVCVELDEKRYKSLSDRKRWEALDIKEIIRKKQLGLLIANLVLASYQKKLGDQIGMMPGSELMEAVKSAESAEIPVSLCDRDVGVTLKRAWRSTPLWKKSWLLATLLASLFDKTEITEEKLAELRQTDVLTELLEEIGEAMPELKTVLIDERDTFLSEKIKSAKGKKIVAVVGAGHVEGIKRALYEDRSEMMDEISSAGEPSPVWKVLGWAIPAIIIGSLGYIAWNKGAAVAGDNVVYWILANGIASAAGAAVALAHPWTILSAFVAAPITSLTPVIGAGYVTAFVQTMVCPPVVGEFQTAIQDMTTFKGWWRNRLLKVFMAFLLPGFGSMIGTWLGGYRIVSNLF